MQIGDRYSKLVLLKNIGAKGGFWECICDCGNKKVVARYNLLNGHNKSCGICRKINTFEFFDKYFLLGFEDNDIKFIIDLEDYSKVKGAYFYPSFEPWGTYLKIYYNKKLIRFARFIMNAKQNEYVDHINRNSLDNRKSNLRIVTNQQNGFNHKLSKKNTSGICGVIWNKQRNKWEAKIKYNYKTIHLGSYIIFKDAVIARLKAEKEYFGEFAPQRHLFKKYGIE